jgi:clan AA aspartic protease
MGLFKQPIAIASTEDGPFETIEALVDTGASYTWLPRDILERLGVKPKSERPFLTADGRAIRRETGTIYVRIDGREHPTPCIFGDEGSLPLLGVVTLEELGFGVDPVNRRLIEVPGLLTRCGPISNLQCPEYCAHCLQYIRKRSLAFLGATYRIGEVPTAITSPVGYHQQCYEAMVRKAAIRIKRD